MPELLEISPNRVYKFFAPNENSYDSLIKKYFWFAKREILNDPYDLAGYCENQYKINERPDWYKKLNMYACCSFTVNPLNKLMWAFYAQSYSGWCLSFPKDRLTPFSRLSLKIVQYVDLSKKHIRTDIDRAFLLKDTIWAFEQEYRLLDNQVHESLNGTKHSWGFDYQDIEIIIGFRMSELYRNAIINFAIDNKIPLYYLRSTNIMDKPAELRAIRGN